MKTIQDYRMERGKLASLEEFLNRIKHPQADKFGADVELKGTYLGFYGSSSCSGWPDLVKELVEKRLGSREFLVKAIEAAIVEQAKVVKETAREAVEDATAVLVEVEEAAKLQK